MKQPIKMIMMTAALLLLAACQTSTTDLSASNNLQLSKEGATKTDTIVKIESYDKDKQININIDGKTHILTPYGESSNKRFSNVNDADRTKTIGVDLLKSSNKGDANANLWVAYLNNSKVEANNIVSDQGFGQSLLVTGNQTEKMLTKGQATYKGYAVANIVGKKSLQIKERLTSDVEVGVDFEKGTFQIDMANPQKDEFIFTDEKIEANQLSFNMRSNEALTKKLGLTNAISGNINGGFYGKEANVIVGQGYVENDEAIGQVGFLADKQ